MKRAPSFVLVSVSGYVRSTYLKFVLAALGPEGVGAADEKEFLGRQMRHDSNVILALVLKKREIFF